ncbi:MAG: MTH1187 family thiamine-binding protein [Candidatus Binatia bacterium]|nr:MTH1187 family thiamine-binding protein [Candidatus Binatia bacterium]
MALIEVSVVPVGTNSPSIGDYIADAVRVLDDARVPYEISAMGTLFEATLKEALPLIQKMHEAAFKRGALRVLSTIVVDDRRDKVVTMKSKVASVKRRLRRTARK